MVTFCGTDKSCGIQSRPSMVTISEECTRSSILWDRQKLWHPIKTHYGDYFWGMHKILNPVGQTKAVASNQDPLWWLFLRNAQDPQSCGTDKSCGIQSRPIMVTISEECTRSSILWDRQKLWHPVKTHYGDYFWGMHKILNPVGQTKAVASSQDPLWWPFLRNAQDPQSCGTDKSCGIQSRPIMVTISEECTRSSILWDRQKLWHPIKTHYGDYFWGMHKILNPVGQTRTAVTNQVS